MIDLWHLDHINSPTTEIDHRREKLMQDAGLSLRIEARNSLFRAGMKFPWILETLLAKESELFWGDTNIREYQELIEHVRPDGVFCLTPYFMEEEMLLRAADQRGIKIASSIISFDNITTRGWMPVTFSQYCLWNKYNQNELYRIYPETRSKNVDIVGAPQFDFYYRSEYFWDEKAWRSELKSARIRTNYSFWRWSDQYYPA